MPPYEPQYESKTDSNEFEIPEPARETGTGQAAVSDSADITIRIWHPDPSAAGGATTWKTDSVLVYMIADLVTASDGRTDESSAAMTAHFDSTGRALVAARRIQTAILEFLACRPGDSVAAAILIHIPANTPGGFSPATAQGALRLAEPGQILLSEEVARRVHETPGIELRAVPGLTTGGDGQAGLAELVWTSPEQLSRLKASITGGAQDGEVPAMGATMIVNAPFEKPATKTTSQARATGVAAQQTVGSPGAISGDRASEPSYQDFAAPPAPFLTRTRMILGGVAIVLVGALVWLLYPTQSAKPPARASEPQVGGVSAPSNPVPATVQPQTTPPQLPPSEPAKPAAVVIKPPATVKPPVDKPRKDRAPATAPAAVAQEPQPVPSVEGMTQKDIPGLLQMARTDAGNGNYDKARREYHIVLQLQPNNTEAKEGLRRLDIAQSDH